MITQEELEEFINDILEHSMDWERSIKMMQQMFRE